jgi:NAD(P)-dependent dehydrogenase (short-subunit alcohol dehydrogenase family)
VSRRVAVVTGGAKGIGGAISAGLAASGMTVVALGRDEAALQRFNSGSRSGAVAVSGRQCDITDERAVQAVFAEIGHVDVLVNNAGVASSSPVHKITLDDWERHLRVNATGAFLCSREVLPGMLAARWGRIVMIASTASHAGAPYVAAYTASKHAVLGLARSLAAEIAGTGVTANTVCPTFARTDMTDRTLRNIVDRTGHTAEWAATTLAAMSPLGRLLEPEEVAAAVAYLVSEAAAAVNGQSLVLDGGGLQL